MLIGRFTGYSWLCWCNRVDAFNPVLWMDGLRPDCIVVYRDSHRRERHSPSNRHREGAHARLGPSNVQHRTRSDRGTLHTVRKSTSIADALRHTIPVAPGRWRRVLFFATLLAKGRCERDRLDPYRRRAVRCIARSFWATLDPERSLPARRARRRAC